MTVRRWFALAPALALLLMLAVVLAVGAQGSAPVSGAAQPAAPEDNVSSAFTYQGYLEDDGDPADGSFDFEFKLYDAVSGCCQVGATVALDGVSVADGIFTVSLDFGDDAFDGGARWLQICVAPAGDPCSNLSPRQPLTAAPYAHSLRPGAVISGSVPASTGALNLSSAANGLNINSSVQDGIYVNEAGWSGFSVQEAGGNGLYAGTTGQHGVLVEYANFSGLAVDFAEDYGLYVDEAGVGGVQIGDSGGEGVSVGTALGNGFNVGQADLNGLYVGSAGINGVDVAGDNLAGYFLGDVIITGTCTGCLLSNFGLNTGDRPLQVGDVVALLGVQPSGVDASPLLLQVGPVGDGAAGYGAAAVGVVVGGAERTTVARPRANESAERLIPREAGSIAPGDYLVIAFSGMAQVRVSAADEAVIAGNRLAVGADGMARPLQSRTVDGMLVSEGAPVVGIALEGLDAGQDGLIWVLVDLQ